MHSAFGYNSLVLQTFGHVRWVLVSNIVAIAATLGVAAVAIAPWGAVGVSWSVFAGLAAQNVTNQLGLRRRLGFRVVDPLVARLLATCVALAGGFYLADRWGVPFGVLAVLDVLVAFGLARVFRSLIRLDEVFPELRKVPVVGRWLVACHACCWSARRRPSAVGSRRSWASCSKRNGTVSKWSC